MLGNNTSKITFAEMTSNLRHSHKMHNPVDKMAFLGFLAGIWVGFGGIAATTVAGGW